MSELTFNDPSDLQQNFYFACKKQTFSAVKMYLSPYRCLPFYLFVTLIYLFFFQIINKYYYQAHIIRVNTKRSFQMLLSFIK